MRRHAHTHEVRGRAALRLKPVLRASEDDEARGGEGTLAPQLELEEAEPGYFRVKGSGFRGRGRGRGR